MNKDVSRLDILADGIFAIVMTILVFEIKVPEISNPSNQEIFNLLKHSYPLFLSYILSFAVLFTYWRGYHSIVSDFARSFDVNFQNIAGGFLLLVALIPFSSHLLGVYSSLPASVIVFSVNVILIGVLLFFMRLYAWKSHNIKNKRITKIEQIHSHIRIFIPIIFSVFAIPVAFINTNIALTILTVAIIFNLLKRSTRIICEFLEIEENNKPKMKTIKNKAQDFTLPDQDGKEHSLSDYLGQNVLIYFYPKDDTPGCTKEACMLRDDFPNFENLNAKVFGISADSVKSHKKFAEKYNLPFTLLSDEKKEVLKKYKALAEKSMFGKTFLGIKRMSYLIGKKGEILKVYENVKPSVHAKEVLEDLNNLK